MKKSIHIQIVEKDFYEFRKIFPIWGEMTFALKAFITWAIKNPEKARKFVKEEIDEI
jgi:hypothetical protein